MPSCITDRHIIESECFISFSVSKARIIGDKDVMVQTGSDINLTCRAEQVMKNGPKIFTLCTFLNFSAWSCVQNTIKYVLFQRVLRLQGRWFGIEMGQG